jgi:ATP-dependent DNA helicase RecQ
MRRRAERTKLDAMVGYATTTGCRRAFILGYFGEAVAASSGCGDCDACAP